MYRRADAAGRQWGMAMQLTIYTPDREKLRGLDATSAAKYFRALLYADAGRLQLEEIRVSIDETNTADGGIDAYARQKAQAGGRGCRFFYQLKTGTTFKPWQDSHLKKELFGSGKAQPSKTLLGSAVKTCMDSAGVYVLVCFAHDFQDEKAKLAGQKLRALFNACGYSRAQVEVWGTGELAAMAERYPSLCMDLGNRSLDGPLMTFDSWASNADMGPPMVWSADLQTVAERIRCLLTGDEVQHVRIIGEPGLGKTRLALEALRGDERLSSAAVYAAQASDFQESRLFGELLKPDRQYEVALVIDECDERDRSSIYGRFKDRPGIKLVTIDHGPELSADQRMEVLQMPPLQDEQIRGILRSYVGKDASDLYRWAHWCDGSARVAHALGENLKANPSDLLRSPASVDLWGRFIHGYEDPRDAEQTATVLEHISLFRKFGFRHPVDSEGRFVASLTAQTDPSITYGRFSRIVGRLRDKRILQGDHTLHIVPRALHLHLWRQWWLGQGQTADLTSLLESIPESLKRWFADMLVYANGVGPAQEAIRRTFDASGDATKTVALVATEGGAGFLRALAEADPDTGMRVLMRSIGSMSMEEIATISDGRMLLVGALCMLAVHQRHFSNAARLLAKLAEQEKSTYSNNARGSFEHLFCLNDAPTQATPDERVALIRELFQEGPKKRDLALAAASELLSTSGHSRIVGVEHQGLQPTLMFWKPKVWGDLFNPWKQTLVMLESEVREDDLNWQRRLSGVLITRSGGLLGFAELQAEAIAILRRQLLFVGADLNGLAKLLLENCRRNYRNLPIWVIDELRSILEAMGTGPFERRFQRFVCFETWEEDHKAGPDGNEQDDPTPKIKVAELAREFLASIDAPDGALAMVLCSDGHRIDQFGAEVAKLAAARSDHLIIQTAIDNSQRAQAGFLCGYMRQVWVSAPKRWERMALSLLQEPAVDWRTKAALLSGVSMKVAAKAMDLAEAGKLNPAMFRLWTHVRKEGPQLTEQEFRDMLNRLLDIGTVTASRSALEIGHDWISFRRQSLDDTSLWALLTKTCRHIVELPYSDNDAYTWQQLATRYRRDFPLDDGKLFKMILSLAARTHVSLMSTPLEVASDIARSSPQAVWPILAKMLGKPAGARRLADWLAGDFNASSNDAPIAAFEPTAVLSWVESDPARRAPLVAGMAPKTLDQPAGALTLGLLERFGADKAVRSSLVVRFWTGVITGPVSVAHTKIRDTARRWQASATHPYVRAWTQELIDEMNASASQERIREERSF